MNLVKRLIAVLSIACLACAGTAATFYVSPGGNDSNTGTSSLHPFATIQHAVNASSSGGTIILMDGTFVDPGNYGVTIKVPLTIKSANGSTRTRIDGSGKFTGISVKLIPGILNLQGITFQNFYIDGEGGALNAYGNCSLQDCVFLNNQAVHVSSGGGSGAAIYSNSQSVSLSNCVFQGNVAATFGGAIYMQETKLTADHTTFSDNRAAYGGVLNMDSLSSASFTSCDLVRNYGYYRGTIDSADGASGPMTLTNCMVTDNRNEVPSYGNLHFGCPTVITGCTFQNNSGGSPVELTNGGTITQSTFLHNNMPYSINPSLNAAVRATSPNAQVNVTNCAFVANSFSAGAEYAENTGVYVSFCTFYGNQSWYGGYAAGTNNALGGFLGVYGCIFWNNDYNTSGNQPQAESDVSTSDGGITQISLSDMAGQAGNNGNVYEDPLFVDPGNFDVHIKPTSPVVAAGGSEANGKTPYDLDGRLRHPTVCMGCYEAPNWDPVDTATGPNGNKLVLWADTSGKTWFWTITPANVLTRKLLPSAGNTVPSHIAVGPDNKAYVFFKHQLDGGVTVMEIPTTGSAVSKVYIPKPKLFTFKTATVDSHSTLHITFVNPSGQMQLLDVPTTGATTTKVYGPYLG